MKQIILLSSLVITLFSCSDPKKDLVITFEDINGLNEGDDVIIKKQNVGKVTNIEFNNDYKMDVYIHLDKVDHLPRDSKFIIGKDGIFSNALYVVPGKSKADLTSKDKINGKAVEELNLNDVVNEFFDEAVKKPAQTQDSVLDELRDIKHEIHEVNEKTH